MFQIRCNKCGYCLPDDSLYCQYCGTEIKPDLSTEQKVISEFHHSKDASNNNQGRIETIGMQANSSTEKTTDSPATPLPRGLVDGWTHYRADPFTWINDGYIEGTQDYTKLVPSDVKRPFGQYVPVGEGERLMEEQNKVQKKATEPQQPIKPEEKYPMYKNGIEALRASGWTDEQILEDFDDFN